MGTVSFPGLGLEFHLNRVAFHIGSWPVYWYGIIIAAGFLLAVLYCCHAAKRFGIKQDDIIDMLFFAVPLSIVGARLYYILFYLDLYRREDGSLDFGAMVRIWDGGLAIYGGIIGCHRHIIQAGAGDTHDHTDEDDIHHRIGVDAELRAAAERKDQCEAEAKGDADAVPINIHAANS